MKDDDTSLLRTLPPDVFESLLDSVEFHWSVTLDELSQDQIRMKVLDASNSGELDGMPAVAIVQRLIKKDDDETVRVDVYDCLGRRLCSLDIATNGLGPARSVH